MGFHVSGEPGFSVAVSEAHREAEIFSTKFYIYYKYILYFTAIMQIKSRVTITLGRNCMYVHCLLLRVNHVLIFKVSN